MFKVGDKVRRIEGYIVGAFRTEDAREKARKQVGEVFEASGRDIYVRWSDGASVWYLDDRLELANRKPEGQADVCSCVSLLGDPSPTCAYHSARIVRDPARAALERTWDIPYKEVPTRVDLNRIYRGRGDT